MRTSCTRHTLFVKFVLGITFIFLIWIQTVPQLWNNQDGDAFSQRTSSQIEQSTLADRCNHHSRQRGPNQRVIAVSVFGPKENELFQRNTSLAFLKDMLFDMSHIYQGWFLRVYHDDSIDSESIHELQCRYDYVDFYEMTGLLVPPPRMWRFLPIGDLNVDTSKYRCTVNKTSIDTSLVSRMHEGILGYTVRINHRSMDTIVFLA
jgi:hypothetical protein